MSSSTLKMYVKLEPGQLRRFDDLVIEFPEENIVHPTSREVKKPVMDDFVIREVDMFDMIQQTKLEFLNTAKIRELSKLSEDASVLRAMIEQLCQQVDILYS